MPVHLICVTFMNRIYGHDENSFCHLKRKTAYTYMRLPELPPARVWARDPTVVLSMTFRCSSDSVACCLLVNMAALSGPRATSLATERA